MILICRAQKIRLDQKPNTCSGPSTARGITATLRSIGPGHNSGLNTFYFNYWAEAREEVFGRKSFNCWSCISCVTRHSEQYDFTPTLWSGIMHASQLKRDISKIMSPNLCVNWKICAHPVEKCAAQKHEDFLWIMEKWLEDKNTAYLKLVQI